MEMTRMILYELVNLKMCNGEIWILYVVYTQKPPKDKTLFA